MKKIKSYITFVLVLISQLALSQTETTSTSKSFKEITEKNISKKGILLGIHIARETMFEVGYFNYKFTENRGKNDQGSGYSISTEHYINRNYIIAQKLATWTSLWGFHMGIASLWYFDLEKNNSVRIRPEVGIAWGRFKYTYGHNIAITNKNMPNISKHMFSVTYFLNLNKKAKW